MQRKIDIANRLREVLLSGHWIANINFKENIDGLTWKQATTSVEGLNSIALLTFHINYYLAGLLHVFHGGSLDIRDKYSFDMPPIQSDEDWSRLRNDFLANAEAFASWVENMPDSMLDDPFTDPKYGNYQRNIEGVIEHSYYHLGQLTLIRKMVLARHTN